MCVCEPLHVCSHRSSGSLGMVSPSSCGLVVVRLTQWHMVGCLVLSYIKEECLMPPRLSSSQSDDSGSAPSNDSTGIFGSYRGY